MELISTAGTSVRYDEQHRPRPESRRPSPICCLEFESQADIYGPQILTDEIHALCVSSLLIQVELGFGVLKLINLSNTVHQALTTREAMVNDLPVQLSQLSAESLRDLHNPVATLSYVRDRVDDRYGAVLSETTEFLEKATAFYHATNPGKASRLDAPDLHLVLTGSRLWNRVRQAVVDGQAKRSDGLVPSSGPSTAIDPSFLVLDHLAHWWLDYGDDNSDRLFVERGSSALVSDEVSSALPDRSTRDSTTEDSANLERSRTPSDRTLLPLGFKRSRERDQFAHLDLHAVTTARSPAESLGYSVSVERSNGGNGNPVDPHFFDAVLGAVMHFISSRKQELHA